MAGQDPNPPTGTGTPPEGAIVPAGDPKANGIDGRDTKGRFVVGNKGGPGNANAKHVAQLRQAMLSAVTPDLMIACIRALLAKALKGDVAAIREVMDRTVGKPVEFDLLDRIQALEEMLNNRSGGTGNGGDRWEP